ncbi:MAG: glycosyltransferase [Draconibacterium sp.]|nr:glycosyltransferase [Draconibacterium sp.]
MHNKKPLFTIVMANYNGGLYIEEAILSLLNQSCQDFELIIVDGGSTDNSIEIIKKYKDHLAWWVSEKDNGQSDAFNKGFARAKGEFYFWVNADDLLLPNSIKHAKDAVNKNPTYKWFAANTVFFTKDGNIEKCSVGPKWNSFLLKNNSIYVYGPTSIFHRSLFEKAGGFDVNLNFTMDGDLWYKFYNQGEKFVRINYFFWGFRIHEESKTSHAFNRLPSGKFAAERRNVLKKNNHQLLKSFSYLLFIYKLITGVYLRSYFYTLKYKGKFINMLK